MTALFTRRSRRAVGLLATPALALATLAALPATTSYAAEPDPAPASSAGTWLEAHLVDGLLPYSFGGYDYGSTIDTALGLQLAGERPETVTEITTAIEDHLGGYVDDYSYTDTWEGSPTFGSTFAGHSSNATAKAAAFAGFVGETPTAFGGKNLVADVEAYVGDSGNMLGRLSDEPTKDGDPYPAGDYANVLGQAFAVTTLDAAGSTETEEATNVLLAQQCAAGYFTLYLAAPGTGCDDGSASPSVDATGTALLMLAGQTDDTDVAAAVANGLEWLENTQAADGSFTDGTADGATNANSTGLAGWALGAAGSTAAAEDAAAWLRSHQLLNVANCVYYTPADTGAVAFGDAERESARTTPIGTGTGVTDQYQKTTAQSLAALTFAPSGGDTQALFTAEYVKAGGKKPVGVVAAAPGEALCAMLGEQSVLGYAGVGGEASLPVLVPATTATSKVRVADASGTVGTVSIKALGAKKVPFTLKAKVTRGGMQVVRVSGLAPRESLTVTYRSKRVAARQAGANGVVTVRFPVGRKIGKATVVVKGQFANRVNRKTFTVTR